MKFSSPETSLLLKMLVPVDLQQAYNAAWRHQFWPQWQMSYRRNKIWHSDFSHVLFQGEPMYNHKKTLVADFPFFFFRKNNLKVCISLYSSFVESRYESDSGTHMPSEMFLQQWLNECFITYYVPKMHITLVRDGGKKSTTALIQVMSVITTCCLMKYWLLYPMIIEYDRHDKSPLVNVCALIDT